jgi:phosphatidylserine/phosphatidylglycerophosphate/cardiolipin synthase-like enzyme
MSVHNTKATVRVGAADPVGPAPQITLLDNQAYFPALKTLLDPNLGPAGPVYMVEYNFFTDDGKNPPALNAGGEPTQIMNELITLAKGDTPVNLVLEKDHSPSIETRNAFTQNLLGQASNMNIFMNDSVSDGFIDHAKLVVRGNTVIAGSHNLTQTSMADNNEVSLQVESKTIAQQAQQYVQDCKNSPGVAHPLTVTDGNVMMVTDTAYEEQLLKMINGCKKGDSLAGSMYDFNFTGSDPSATPDPSAQAVMKALVAAERRGVKLTLLLDHESLSMVADEMKHNADAAAYLMKYAPKTQPPTVQVVLGSPDKISHQKFLIKNASQVLLGSSNWTDSDFNHRHQVNWLVNDGTLGLSLQNTLLSEISSANNVPSSTDEATKHRRSPDRFDP